MYFQMMLDFPTVESPTMMVFAWGRLMDSGLSIDAQWELGADI